jgi:two-component system LytT family response regulator
MEKITTVIIDDEFDAVNFLSSIIKEYCKNIEIVGVAHSVEDGKKILKTTKPQLLLLDVEMPDGTGFNLLEEIKDIDFRVIFITAYNHYAIQAIKFSAIDYILKPINIREFLASIKKVSDLINNHAFNQQFSHLMENLKNEKPTKIGLPQSDGIEFVETAEIIRIKAEGSYSTVFLKNNREILVSKNLGEIQELLVDRHFFRSHNSHLINLRFVKKYVKADGGYIVMENNDTIPVSRTKKDSFLQLMSSTLE